MKTIPPPCPEPDTGPKYWRSLDQLADTPEFREWAQREFPAGASELTDPTSRRNFVKIMSASFLLAGLGGGCRRPVEKILPFGKMPENYIHGVPQFYATARPTRSGAIPLVVKASEGRPIKVEGNALHPDSNGGTDAFTQASILNLYDPDRATRFTKDGNAIAPEVAADFLDQLGKRFQGVRGQGLSILAESKNSPSRDRLLTLLGQRAPQTRWHVYDPLDLDIERRIASAAIGRSLRPYYRFDKASVILSLDADFLGTEEDSYRHIRNFAKGRKQTKSSDPMSRLYVIESLMSITGANADHRLRKASSAIGDIAAQFAVAIVDKGQVQDQWISECAKDLLEHPGKALVVAGHGQPAEVHTIVLAINQALGSIGQTLTFTPASEIPENSIEELVKDLNAGEVDTLVILGGNPIYNAPADLDLATAIRKAKQVIRLGYYEDETFSACTWHLPEAHYLESWGDARTSDGTLVAIQPLIEPLFGGITELEVLARIAGSAQIKPYDVARETFRGFAGNNFDAAWGKFLHDGFAEKSAPQSVVAQLKPGVYAQAKSGLKKAPANAGLEVVFRRDYRVDDGRYTNNGWLQEFPDPITKIVWENVITLSQATAATLGVKVENHENNHLYVPWLRVEVGGRTVEGPAWVQAGQADGTIGLALGYGRPKAGRVGGSLGYNAYGIRTFANPGFVTGAKLTDQNKPYQIATTQDHWSMEGRPIIREANLAEYEKNPRFAQKFDMEKPPSTLPLYPNPLDNVKGRTPHQWGMSIDLSGCVGCGACTIACQSENNIPIVGKEMVRKNREMHWIRIDRYFTGSVADPQVINQPMLCQHCEAAPCENVCPVNATSHDEEGLNVMTYNRCVGTRYCSNNCPYKVRRFNFFDYNKRPLKDLYKPPFATITDGEWELKRWYKSPESSNRPTDEWELFKLVKNPDVTVRMRGVMEKCSFCIQRIEGAKIAQKVKAGASGDVEVKDGTFTTACAQACPADAIVFGNVADPNSRVSKLKAQDRDYKVLEFLSTRPRVTYLARVRNPNPKIPGVYETPESSKEFAEKNGHGEGHETGPHGAGTEAHPEANESKMHETAGEKKGAH